MITRLRQRVSRPVLTHDDNGSMLLALFATMIVTSLVSVVLMTSISQQAKTRKATDFTFAGQAADTAVNDAMLMANLNDASGTPSSVDYYDGSPVRKGVVGDFMWTWKATQDPVSSTPAWKIVAVGCRNLTARAADPAANPSCTPNSSRTVTATLSGKVVDSADSASGEVAYLVTPRRSFNRALFADQDLVMQGSSKVTSYKAAGSVDNTGLGQVATNGLAAFDPGVQVDGIYMSNTQASPSGDRCHSLLCDPGRTPRLIHDIRAKLKVSGTAFIKTAIDDACINAPGGGPLRAWVASEENPNQIKKGVQCYSSMTFDEPITEVQTGGQAGGALVYVDGPITVLDNAKVNTKGGNMPVASELQIFSSGSLVSLGGTTAKPAKVAWALWAPDALCAPSNPTGAVTVYGSMVCKKIFTQGAFTAKWDEALRTFGMDDAGVATVWDIDGYREGL